MGRDLRAPRNGAEQHKITTGKIYLAIGYFYGYGDLTDGNIA
jgi:hypothetical protein